MKVRCNICGKEFEKKKSMTNHRRWHDLPEYKEFQQNHKEMLSKIQKNINHPRGKNHPFYGKEGPFKNHNHSEESKKKMSEAKMGIKNPMWKGGNIGNRAIHYRIKRNKPKSKTCEICNENRKLDLTNKDHKYSQDLEAWQWLCRSCHMKYDIKQGLRINTIKNIRSCLIFK